MIQKFGFNQQSEEAMKAARYLHGNKNKNRKRKKKHLIRYVLQYLVLFLLIIILILIINKIIPEEMFYSSILSPKS